MRISDWSSDVCSSDLQQRANGLLRTPLVAADDAAWSTLQPARDIDATTLVSREGIDDTPGSVRHDAFGFIERQVCKRLAAIADGPQHQAGVQRPRTPGRSPGGRAVPLRPGFVVATQHGRTSGW